MNTFNELALSPSTAANLARHGFTTPTPVQAQSMPPALAGRDVIATAQTGTGKTLAFVCPVVESLLKTPRSGAVEAVILSPTRELAIQIQETFEKIAANTGIRAAVVVGGINEQRQLRLIRGKAAVVIATPGRLCDFLGRKLINLKSVRMLVLDEADRMLDMGFLPSINRILADLPGSRQTLFFSATIEPSVAHLMNTHLTDPVRIGIGPTTKPAENVDLTVYEVEPDAKMGLLKQLLKSESGAVLVFARTKHGTDRLADRLSAEGFRTARLHGDRTQNQRNQALKGFQNGDYRILVATDIAARGIHVDGIAQVINYDLPKVAEDFIHRVGRTGRAGARGSAVTFAMRSERNVVAQFERTLKIEMKRLPVPESAMASKPAAGSTKVIVLPVKEAAERSQSARPRSFGRRRNAASGRRRG